MALEVQLGEYRRAFTEWTPDQGRVFKAFYAIDTETTEIDRENPQIVPALVLATACDDTRGVLLSRNNLPTFLRIHHDSSLICHNAAFDLKVMQQVLGKGQDLYKLVEHGRVWPGGPRGLLPWGSHGIRTCPWAYGSSYHELATGRLPE